MRIALTVWGNRISPLFDSAAMLLVADIEKGGEVKRLYEPLKNRSAFSRAARLDELGVKVLICGGISDLFANLIEARNIRIISFAAGRVEEVLEAFVAGDIYRKDLRMPGCEKESGGWDAL